MSDTQKDFLKFEQQRLRAHEDAKGLRIEQLTSENEQLKIIISEMRREIESIREKTGGPSGISASQQAQQTIFELRRELYKIQAEKKSIELEKEFLEQQYREVQVDAEMFKQMSEKENELYDVKIRLIQKENEIIMLKQKLNSAERSNLSLKSERDKLIEISNELKAKVMTLEKQGEMKKQSEKLQLYKEVAADSISQANMKESKLDQLKIEVQQMRELVNRFKFEERKPTDEQIATFMDEKENISSINNRVRQGNETFGANNSQKSNSPQRGVRFIDDANSGRPSNQTQPFDTQIMMGNARSIFDDGSYNDTDSFINKTSKQGTQSIIYRSQQSERPPARENSFREEDGNRQRSRSKKRLEVLKNTYNSKMLIEEEDMFPVKGGSPF
ncbi:hypothetical protein FGO68_gene13745 [Halteria grandinella]|uniref:Uncharacterized protein n=1 Tax=Halteria grandinella TaxID=5974 RepID=A0A8J8T572_HALGN|nr:hypothetical protein FGO68_gene13745 [Halteria grandinella]